MQYNFHKLTAAVLLVSLLICCMTACGGEKFSERGEYALECVSAAASRVRSFVLIEDVAVFDMREGHNAGKQACVVRYREKGSYQDASAVFVDGKYVGSIEEYNYESNNRNYASYEERMATLNRIMPLGEVIIEYYYVRMLAKTSLVPVEDKDFYEVISKEAIGKKLRIDFLAD